MKGTEKHHGQPDRDEVNRATRYVYIIFHLLFCDQDHSGGSLAWHRLQSLLGGKRNSGLIELDKTVECVHVPRAQESNCEVDRAPVLVVFGGGLSKWLVTVYIGMLFNLYIIIDYYVICPFIYKRSSFTEHLLLH